MQWVVQATAQVLVQTSILYLGQASVVGSQIIGRSLPEATATGRDDNHSTTKLKSQQSNCWLFFYTENLTHKTILCYRLQLILIKKLAPALIKLKTLTIGLLKVGKDLS